MIKWLTIIKYLCTYALPTGTMLYYAVFEKLLSKNVSVTAKIGIGGLTALIITVLILVFVVKKISNAKINDLTDKIIEELDNTKKKELIVKKQKVNCFIEIFNNICLIVPFIIVLIMVSLIEQKMIEVRGILFAIIIELVIGFAFNFWLQSAKLNEKKNI